VSDDLDGLARLYDATLPEPWSRQSLARQIAAPGAITLLCLDPDDAAVGFALARVGGDEAELLGVGVAPDRRRRGLARALLREVERRARAAGARRLYLEVAEDNVAALALYGKVGYGTVGRRPDYYRDAASGRRAALILGRDLVPDDGLGLSIS
jgi:ribosomal-protein-alanine N-acetyltransferase